MKQPMMCFVRCFFACPSVIFSLRFENDWIFSGVFEDGSALSCPSVIFSLRFENDWVFILGKLFNGNA